MKNITLSADEALIEAARIQAQSEQTTLNEQFRLWLAAYVNRRQSADDVMALLDEMREYARINQPEKAGRKFTRDEMNER